MHHACDASSYATRALNAAFALLLVTPPEILNTTTTGTQPNGNSCLHLASAGSDKGFARAKLVAALLDRRANLEQKESNGNTALLLASGQGDTSVFNMLMQCGADTHATNHHGFGAFQLAKQCSQSSSLAADQHNVPNTWKKTKTKAHRQHHGGSHSRAGRHAQQRATNRTAAPTRWQSGNGQQRSDWQQSDWRG